MTTEFDLLHIPLAWPSARRRPPRQSSWALMGPSHWGTQNCCSSGGIRERETMKDIQMSQKKVLIRLHYKTCKVKQVNGIRFIECELTSEAGVVKVETLGWPLGTSIITKPSDTTARAHSPSSSSSARLYGPLHTQTHTLNVHVS